MRIHLESEREANIKEGEESTRYREISGFKESNITSNA